MRRLRFAGPGGSALASLRCLVRVSPLALLAACAQTNSSAYHSQVGVVAPRQQVVMSLPRYPVAGSQDQAVGGKPGLRQRRAIDDPNEPFSPNYGPPLKVDAARAADPVAPVHKTDLSEREAEAVIARAVAMHEVREQ